MTPEEVTRDYKYRVKDVYAALLYVARVLSKGEVMIAKT